MFAKNHPEVLVVGAGPVGLLAALRLARLGVDVEIVDRQWRTGAHSYALALHPHSLAILHELGLAEQVIERAYPVRRVAVYDGTTRRAELNLPERPDDTGFVAAMRQDVLEGLLEEALRQEGMKVLWNHELSRLAAQKDRVAVTVDKLAKQSVGYAVAHTEWIVAGSKRTKLPLVIGADGHSSLVRRSLGIDYPSVGPPEHFAVFEFDTDAELNDEMSIVLDDRTTSVLWPLPGGACRWSFQLPDYSARESPRMKERVAVQFGSSQFPVLAEKSLRSLIAERAPWFDGKIGEIRWRLVVRFERRLAGSFGSGRAWLAGDAAHMTGPAGMQSMNVGLREADELANVMNRMLRDDPSPEPLESYNSRRLAQWRFLLGLEGGLKPTSATDSWIAEHAPRLLPCLPASGEELSALAGQLGLEADSAGP